MDNKILTSNDGKIIVQSLTDFPEGSILGVNDIIDGIDDKKNMNIDGKNILSVYDIHVSNSIDGVYTVKIKIDNNIKKYDKYQIASINDFNSIVDIIDVNVEDGYVVFTTNHLGKFAFYGAIWYNNKCGKILFEFKHFLRKA